MELETLTLATLTDALLDPRRYPHPVERVEKIETHISIVLLAGAHAYKLKKPLDLGFLDYSTLAKRRAACEEELRLNRRTAPELYLGVLPIGGTPAAPRLGSEPAIEYAVHMRRFPEEDLAVRRVRSARLTASELQAFAGELVRFHASAAAAGAESPFGDPQSVVAPALDNFTTLAQSGVLSAARERLEELRAWSTGEAARLAPLFAARKRAGRVRDGHGDLHLGNIVFLAGRAVPFDCIEFAPALRWIDVMSEVAFLIMDLHARREPALGSVFLDAYVEGSGDHGGLAVLPFYLVYRAMVRAKVAALGACAPERPAAARAPAVTEAHEYLALAERLARPRPRALLLMHGLSGSGKTRLAARVVARAGALRLRSDIERKRLFGLAAEARSGSGLGRALYAPGASEAAYARLAELAGGVLAAGFPVVVDATSLARARRDAFRALARAQGVPFRILSCRAAPLELRRRVAARAAEARDPSEASLAVLEAQLRAEEPLGADEREETIELDTEATPACVEDALDAALRELALLPGAGRGGPTD